MFPPSLQLSIRTFVYHICQFVCVVLFLDELASFPPQMNLTTHLQRVYSGCSGFWRCLFVVQAKQHLVLCLSHDSQNWLAARVFHHQKKHRSAAAHLHWTLLLVLFYMVDTELNLHFKYVPMIYMTNQMNSFFLIDESGIYFLYLGCFEEVRTNANPLICMSWTSHLCQSTVVLFLVSNWVLSVKSVLCVLGLLI